MIFSSVLNDPEALRDRSSALSSTDYHLETGRDFGRLAQHHAGRAVLVMAHRDGAFDGAGRNTASGHREMHVDPGEHLRVRGGTFRRELDRAAHDLVAATPEDQHDIIGGAATGPGKDGFHGPGR